MGEVRVGEAPGAVGDEHIAPSDADIVTPDLNLSDDDATPGAGSSPVDESSLDGSRDESPESAARASDQDDSPDGDQTDDPADAPDGEPAPQGSRSPRLIQIGALLVVACAALLPTVASGFFRALTRNGSVLGIVGAVVWLGVLAVAAITIDRGFTRS